MKKNYRGKIGIPLLTRQTDEVYDFDVNSVTDFRVSLLSETHSGNYKGVIGSLGITFVDEDRSKADELGYYKYGGNIEGLCFGGIHANAGNLKGAIGSFLHASVDNELNGLQCSTLYNPARINGKCAIQLGYSNYLEEYNDKGTVIQFGIKCKIEDKLKYFFHIKGLKNIFKKSKL